MKQCPTCREEFADKFASCPVDGTPLNVYTAAVANESAAFTTVEHPSINHESPTIPTEETFTSHASATPAAHMAAEREEFHLTILQEEGLTSRLLRELREEGRQAQLTWPEFKRDPAGFTKRTAQTYGQVTKRFLAQPNVPLAILIAVVGLFTTLGIILALDQRPSRVQVAEGVRDEELELVQMIETEIPEVQKEPDPGTAGMAKGKGGGSKPKQERAAGGGGGGRNEQKPASFGKLPTAQLAPQILPPNPRPPAITKPNLPVPPTIDADPALFPPDTRNIAFGDPKSKSTEVSSGPGTGGGIGTGTGGGVGPGEGGGFGPGRGGNTGGGDRNEGGGGAGGGGGGGDYNRTFNPREVTRKAIITHKPEPGFTEDARKNNVTGLVKLRLVLASSGQVTNISVVKGLPDGLTEKAIGAARQIRFTPAEKDGRTVSQWITLEYNFNIY